MVHYTVLPEPRKLVNSVTRESVLYATLCIMHFFLIRLLLIENFSHSNNPECNLSIHQNVKHSALLNLIFIFDSSLHTIFFGNAFTFVI